VDGHTTTCGTTIIAGSTCTIGFIFSPTGNGPVTATASLATNSYDGPQLIQLNGTGKLVAPLQFTLPPQTEVYGQPFPETVLVSSGSPAPSGTISFGIGKTAVLCSLTPPSLPRPRATLQTAVSMSAPMRSTSAIAVIATTPQLAALSP
jgi:hypothetical protein